MLVVLPSYEPPIPRFPSHIRHISKTIVNSVRDKSEPKDQIGKQGGKKKENKNDALTSFHVNRVGGGICAPYRLLFNHLNP